MCKRLLESRRRHAEENWADLGDALLLLVDKAYQDLHEEVRDMIAVNKYLEQLVDPQILLAVRQQHPRTVVEAVLAAIELGTYFPCNDHNEHVTQPDNQLRATIDQQLSNVIGTLLCHIELLESVIKLRNVVEEGHYNSRKQVTCHRCGQVGHYARECASKHASQHENKPTESTEQDARVVSSDINTITINCVSIYSLKVCIKGVWVSFLIDAETAVSFVDGRVWDSMNNTVKLNPMSMRLVGVDGVPLQVHRSTIISLSICGLTIDQNFIVVYALTSQGILGMHFLQSNHCILNLAEETLSAGGHSIPLDPNRVGKQVLHTQR